MKNKSKNNDEFEEDTTKYGEFISSYFVWTTLSKQKRRAEELNDMTKRKKQIIDEKKIKREKNIRKQLKSELY